METALWQCWCGAVAVAAAVALRDGAVGAKRSSPWEVCEDAHYHCYYCEYHHFHQNHAAPFRRC